MLCLHFMVDCLNSYSFFFFRVLVSEVISCMHLNVTEDTFVAILHNRAQQRRGIRLVSRKSKFWLEQTI